MNTAPASAGPSPSAGASGAVDTHVKAEMGAAALERVVAAARAAQEEHQRNAEDLRAVCDLCNVRRADLRGPCGHKYHARSVGLSWTRRYVDRRGQLYRFYEKTTFLRNSQVRTGRWHSYETMYAQRIVADFEAGTMPLSEGTKLGNFLCNILNCSPSRLSKKLKIGKKYFQRCQTRPMGEEDFAKHREAQKRLSDLEEMFLMAESQTNRGIANTQLLSERIQIEWRERFIGHAHTVNQKLKNAWDWNSNRKKADLSSGALSKLLESITPNKPELAVNSLAPFFLVTHNHGGGPSSPADGNIPSHLANLNSLGHPMMDSMLQQHTMRLFAPPDNLQSQPGMPSQQALPPGVEPGSDAGGNVPFGSPTHQPFPSAFLPARQATHGPQQSPTGEGYGPKPTFSDWFEQPTQRGQQHGPGTSMQNQPQHPSQHGPSPEGMDEFGDELWTSLESNLASLGYQNHIVLEDMEQEPLDSAPASQQWAHAHNQGQGSFGETPSSSSTTTSSLHDPQALFLGGPGGAPHGTGAGMPPTVTVRDAGRGNPRPTWQSTALGGAGSIGPGGGGGAGGGNPGGGSGGSGGNPGGGGGGNPGGGGGGGGGDGGGPGGPPNDGGGDGTDDNEEGSHRFEDFIGNFLEQIPFEAVDVWVPLCNQDQEGSEVVLFHAGYFTNVKELEEWGEYSTNFSFRQGQGLPGRVYGSNESEWQEDVNTLGHSSFLRLNGARNIGIRTSFGVPVVSRWGVTFVIVFYSRSAVQMDNDMKSFIERTVSAWKFDATVDTEACPNDANASAGKPGAMRA